MSAVAPALLAVAAGVGVGHAVMPDHWVPLAVVGRVNRYSTRRVTRLAALAGTAHVLVSVILGAVIVAVGLRFRSSIEGAQDTIVGALLLATGVGFAAVELLGHGHSHGPDGHSHGPGHRHGPGGHRHGPAGHTHDPAEHAHGPARDLHDHDHDARRRGLLQVVIPFGAAASPDLTILPVFLAAAAIGAVAAIGTLVVFAVATIGTIVLLTTGAFLTGYKVEGNWLDRWGNLLTASVLLVIGALVISRII